MFNQRLSERDWTDVLDCNEVDNGTFTSLGIMGKTFLRCRKVLVNDTSWRSDDSTSVWQLGPDFDNRVAQLVKCMNMAQHESFTHKIINHHITSFTID